MFGVLGEYRIARFGRFYKEVGGFIWRVSECKKLVGAVTVGDGVDGGDFTWRVVNMDLIVEVRTNKPSTLTDCFTSP